MAFASGKLLIMVNVLKKFNTSCLPRHIQTAQTLIRLLLKKQSDQGLPCLQFWLALCDFQPWKPTFFENRKRKVFVILEHLLSQYLFILNFHFVTPLYLAMLYLRYLHTVWLMLSCYMANPAWYLNSVMPQDKQQCRHFRRGGLFKL